MKHEQSVSSSFRPDNVAPGAKKKALDSRSLWGAQVRFGARLEVRFGARLEVLGSRMRYCARLGVEPMAMENNLWYSIRGLGGVFCTGCLTLRSPGGYRISE